MNSFRLATVKNTMIMYARLSVLSYTCQQFDKAGI